MGSNRKDNVGARGQKVGSFIGVLLGARGRNKVS